MVAEAVEKLARTKEAEGMSALYLRDIHALLGDFAQLSVLAVQYSNRKFAGPYDSKRIGLVAKENRRRLLVVLFNFAKAQGWLRANEEFAADALGADKIKRREVEIFTPRSCRSYWSLLMWTSFRISP